MSSQSQNLRLYYPCVCVRVRACVRACDERGTAHFELIFIFLVHQTLSVAVAQHT